MDSDTQLLASLNQITSLSVWKIQTSRLIVPIQLLLEDPQKEDYEKFLLICHKIDVTLKRNIVNDPLSKRFFDLLKKEILDFVRQEIKQSLKRNSYELQMRLANIIKRFNGKNIIPSPLRDLLIELKISVEACAKKNHWPVPTGIKQLIVLLANLDCLQDADLLELLNRSTEIIAERLKCSYLMRDSFTYFLYRNFYAILSKLAGYSFETINRKITYLKGFGLEKRKRTDIALTNLYLFLLDLKEKTNAESWDNQGKTLGIFSNKLPDGIYRLRTIFNKLVLSLPLQEESQIQIIKIFMQLKGILFEKAVLSKMRAFRTMEVGEFYHSLHNQIENIYSVLSIQDQEVFCEINNSEESNQVIKERLVVLKDYALLSHPENITNLFDDEHLPKPIATIQPRCSH